MVHQMVSLSCAAVAGGALLKIIQLLRADTSSATGDEDGMQAHRIGAPRLMAGAAHEGDDANFARRERPGLAISTSSTSYP